MSLVKALDQLYQRHRQQFFNCAMNVLKCPDQAEDAVHEAFVKLFGLPQTPWNLKSYAFRTVRNAALDLLRRQTRLAEATLESAGDDWPETPGAQGQEDTQRQINQAMTILAPEEREVVLLHLHSDLKFREIASVMECPAGTVACWYRRGLQKLRQEMEKSNGRVGTSITSNAPARPKP